MRAAKLGAVALLATMLAGCLEVKQHPGWIRGEYAGKKDDRQFQRLFHNDKLAWFGVITNRNLNQNEYNRANP
jgi:hypothetical protein